MQSDEDGKPGCNTVLKIINQSSQPEVDVLETEDGSTSGPNMVFLGSIASKQAVRENFESSLLAGKIAGNHRLVLSNVGPMAGRKIFLISGIVDPELDVRAE
ncbi:MAG: hypothetical protein ACXWLH_02985 [Candidatus Saccharimonadales bacterium]